MSMEDYNMTLTAKYIAIARRRIEESDLDLSSFSADLDVVEAQHRAEWHESMAMMHTMSATEERERLARLGVEKRPRE